MLTLLTIIEHFSCKVNFCLGFSFLISRNTFISKRLLSVIDISAKLTNNCCCLCYCRVVCVIHSPFPFSILIFYIDIYSPPKVKHQLFLLHRHFFQFKKSIISQNKENVHVASLLTYSI